MFKQFLLNSIIHEMKVIRRLATKIQNNQGDYRPKENIRSITELLQYLSACGTNTIRYWYRTDTSVDFRTFISESTGNAKNITPKNFVAAMDQQIELITKLFDKITEEDLLNKEVDYPWGEKAKLGEFDVVLNASYDPKRSEFLYYPKDSGENEPFPCESVFKLGCFGYFVLTLKEFSFDYTGDPLKLPTPIRVAKGNSAEKELLTMKNINLEIGKSDILNIKKMIIDNSGSAIVYSALLNSIQGNSKISSKIKIHKVPYKIKSYYLAFSKLTKINNENINFIWEKLSKIINNSDKMRMYFKKYHLSYEIKN